MGGADGVVAVDIGDGAGDFQDASWATGGQACGGSRLFEQRLALGVESTKFADLPGDIAEFETPPSFRNALELNVASPNNTGPDDLGLIALRNAAAAEFAELYGGHIV